MYGSIHLDETSTMVPIVPIALNFNMEVFRQKDFVQKLHSTRMQYNTLSQYYRQI